MIHDCHHQMSSIFYVPNKYSIHAERHAIMNVPKKLRKFLSKCSIAVIKILQNGTIIECGPCSMCNNLLKKYGIVHKKMFTKLI